MGSHSPFADLSYRWRATAHEWRDTAGDASLPHAVRAIYQELAGVAESFANELDATVTDWLAERLTIQQAASESGYSEEALRRAIRQNRVPNAGRRGKPLILRKHLPKRLG